MKLSQILKDLADGKYEEVVPGGLRPGAKGKINGVGVTIVDIYRGVYIAEDSSGNRIKVFGNGITINSDIFIPEAKENRGGIGQ